MGLLPAFKVLNKTNMKHDGMENNNKNILAEKVSGIYDGGVKRKETRNKEHNSPILLIVLNVTKY